MPATTAVNGRTVVHKTSGGVATAFPDVCKTPSPGGPVPIPYPNVAQSVDTAMGSSTVTVDGNPIMLKSSFFAVSTGDEAGTLLGVVSNTIKGKAYPRSYSFDVQIEGENVFRMADFMLLNGGSPTNTPPACLVQEPLVSLPPPPPPGTQPEPEVTRLAWQPDEAFCGDVVTLECDVKNAISSDFVFVSMTPQDAPDKMLRSFALPIPPHGQSRTELIAKRGPYAKEVKHTARQKTMEGVKETAAPLVVKTIPDAQEMMDRLYERRRCTRRTSQDSS
jgi:hypothetical protein